MKPCNIVTYLIQSEEEGASEEEETSEEKGTSEEEVSSVEDPEDYEWKPKSKVQSVLL